MEDWRKHCTNWEVAWCDEEFGDRESAPTGLAEEADSVGQDGQVVGQGSDEGPDQAGFFAGSFIFGSYWWSFGFWSSGQEHGGSLFVSVAERRSWGEEFFFLWFADCSGEALLPGALSESIRCKARRTRSRGSLELSSRRFAL